MDIARQIAAAFKHRSPRAMYATQVKVTRAYRYPYVSQAFKDAVPMTWPPLTVLPLPPLGQKARRDLATVWWS